MHPNSAVIPRESGVSSTPRLLRIAALSLDTGLPAFAGNDSEDVRRPVQTLATHAFPS